jgi:hypothetical protein
LEAETDDPHDIKEAILRRRQDRGPTWDRIESRPENPHCFDPGHDMGIEGAGVEFMSELSPDIPERVEVGPLILGEQSELEGHLDSPMK